MADEKPDYKVYRSRPRLPARTRRREPRLEELRAPDAARQPDYEVHAPRPRPRRRSRSRAAAASAPGRDHGSPGRVLKWLAIALLAGSRSPPCCSWSRPQIQRGDLADEVGAARPGPYPLTGANTILVLGSDARTEGLAEPGSPAARAARTRSCCCGSAAARTRRSRSRATPSSTSPATGPNKINAAYAIGGPGARHADRQGVPRHRGQPRRRGELRELPAADRRARRRDLQGRLRALAHQRRPPQRRLHAALPSGETRSTAARRSRSPARARTCATRARTTSRARGASSSSSRR